MRPEKAAGAREAQGRFCHCPEDEPQRPSPPPGLDSSALWRPWIPTPGDAELTRTGSQHVFSILDLLVQVTAHSRTGMGLYLPASKRQEYLQSSGEKVLASFPVQATIHFYNDESDSDSEEHEEETQPCPPPCQEARGLEESGPGGKSTDQALYQRWPPGERGGLCGEGQLPHSDPSGNHKCSSKE
ncbi:protein ripply3 [Otolemur garnettii]|uniref:protein ripply3 n=1 Tax=Otolemur garnettii TaxID=30611 RepID=UPI00064476F1|nr:protein ripply3 [Otolemur garnettii]